MRVPTSTSNSEMAAAPRAGVRSTRTYLRVFFFVLSISLGSILAFSGVVIFATGENYSVGGAAARQQHFWDEGRICLYDSALTHTTTAYKLALYRAVKPDVLVLGSSRMMQVRPSIFSTTMVNAGGGGGSPGLDYHFLRSAFAEHVPRHVLLGVDFWALNEAFQAPDNMNLVPLSITNPTLKINNLLLPIKWIFDGNVKLGELSQYVSNCHIGAPAAARHDGFGPRGSYYYNSLVFGLRRPPSLQFTDTLDRINEGKRRFQYGRSVSAAHYQNFAQVARFLRESGVAFSIILPPVSSVVYKAMRAKGADYDYVWELERRLAEDFEAISFTDPSAVSTSDCEFIDGFHAGDVVYSRIVAAVVGQYPKLKALVDRDELDRMSELRSLAYNGKYRFFSDAQEIDFLQLGCDKSAGGIEVRE